MSSKVMSRSGIALPTLPVVRMYPAAYPLTKEPAMPEPIKLVAFCGSLRKGSFNRMALQAFIERVPQGTSVETIEIGDWPLYNADVQAQGFPAPVQAAQQKMLAAAGIV